MAFSDKEFEALLEDDTKVINEDISWTEDEDHSPSVVFQVEVQSQPGWSLFARGSYNRLAETLSFVLILKTVGRIYGLDLGTDHRNPSGKMVGEKHKHRWKEGFGVKEAYVPEDITARIDQVELVWRQFCQEAKIKHGEIFHAPPPIQEELF